MLKELYFDIVSDEWAGGLYILKSEQGNSSFHYHCTASDLDAEKTVITTFDYTSFADFWKELVKNDLWFTLHPLYIHPDQRPFIKEALKKVNWNRVADEKWREMYKRQWNKVLTNPATYYQPLG